MAHPESESESEAEELDLPSPAALFDAADLTEYVANRTRNRHVLQPEDFERAAQYGV
jgi:hypothetical protein